MSHEHPRTVLLSSIKVDPDFNVRTQYDPKGIQELADAIKAEGLQTPLTIERVSGNNGDTVYRLISGNRRRMAMMLNRWGNKEIPVVVREFESRGKAYLSNLAENTAREDVHPYDQAKRFFELETGAISVPSETEGGEPEVVKLARKEIALATSLSQAHIGNLIRSFKNLSEDSKKAWRKHDLPLSFVFELARTVDGAPVSDEEQEETLAEYLAAKEAENATGRRRKNKNKNKDGEGGEEGGSPKRKVVKDLFNVLCGQADDVKGLEKAFLMGKIQGIRFMTGDVGVRSIASTSWANASDAIEKVVAKQVAKIEEE
jgi:ParB-like chromosome segregation protein Spo0J